MIILIILVILVILVKLVILVILIIIVSPVFLRLMPRQSRPLIEIRYSIMISAH